MVQRIATHLLLRPEDIAPSHEDWEVIGTFNPGAVRFGGDIVILFRVAERPKERRSGWTALPCWSQDHGPTVDWVRDEELEPVDPRVVRRKRDGRIRLTFLSHLRIAVCRDGRSIDRVDSQALLPEDPSEMFGIEDPRITPLNGRYYITYVAVSSFGPATALASTMDFKTFERHGIIFCPENKDVVLFPKQIDGQYAALHRPVGGAPFSAPQMWVARSPDLIHWGQHQHLYGGEHPWETGRVGAGAPPLELSSGWLEIYHGASRPANRQDVGKYYGAAMLLDKADPSRVLRVGSEPLLQPEAAFEREGFVADVVFPTGAILDDDLLLVFYGASDKYSAVVELSLGDVL